MSTPVGVHEQQAVDDAVNWLAGQIVGGEA